jgi:TatD DNase family protein
MRLIDTHAHLDDRRYAPDRDLVIARAAAESIGIVTVGADLSSSEAAVRLAHKNAGVWCSVGVHPHDAKTLDREGFARLATLAAEDRVVAIGEIGLDYYRDLSPRDVQRRVFIEQLALARERNLPVILHNRDATEDYLKILNEVKLPAGGVVHSFLGDVALARRFLKLGLYLGIGGPVTYPANDVLRQAVAAVPLERIVLETDCPYLTPVPHRGKRNEPAYVSLVAEEVARVRGISVNEVARQTTEGASALFRLAAPPEAPSPGGRSPRPSRGQE